MGLPLEGSRGVMWMYVRVRVCLGCEDVPSPNVSVDTHPSSKNIH